MVVHTQAGTRFADARSTAYEPTAASRTYYLPMPADGDLDTTPPCSTSLPPRSLDDTVCRAQTDSSTARRRSVLLEPWASLKDLSIPPESVPRRGLEARVVSVEVPAPTSAPTGRLRNRSSRDADRARPTAVSRATGGGARDDRVAYGRTKPRLRADHARRRRPWRFGRRVVPRL